MQESGFHGVPAYLWSGLLAPIGTPIPVIEKINAALNTGLKADDVRASIAKLGLETRIRTPREFAERLADEARVWAAAVRESKIKLD
jgi:tripartite-type tricarboxylate transporter receptor subunit TctC